MSWNIFRPDARVDSMRKLVVSEWVTLDGVFERGHDGQVVQAL
jgi:hypothetical protein